MESFVLKSVLGPVGKHAIPQFGIEIVGRMTTTTTTTILIERFGEGFDKIFKSFESVVKSIQALTF